MTYSFVRSTLSNSKSREQVKSGVKAMSRLRWGIIGAFIIMLCLSAFTELCYAHTANVSISLDADGSHIHVKSTLNTDPGDEQTYVKYLYVYEDGKEIANSEGHLLDNKPGGFPNSQDQVLEKEICNFTDGTILKASLTLKKYDNPTHTASSTDTKKVVKKAGQPPKLQDVSVGGVWVPVDKFGLLAPYIGLASTILVATAATAIYVKRVKRRKEKQ